MHRNSLMPPQAQTITRIRRACSEFSRATGVTLNFEPSDAMTSSLTPPRLWQAPIHMEGQSGLLHIAHPAHAPLDQRLHDACQLADVFARLLHSQQPAMYTPIPIDSERDRFRQLQSELELISQAFITHQTEFSSEDHALTAVTRTFSKHEIGGDLCEIIFLSDRHTLIALGDATGNGLPAAMILSFVRGALYSQLNQSRHELQLDRIMNLVNRAFLQLATSYHYMSLFLGLIDTRERTIRYVNAGHPPLLIMRSQQCLTLAADIPLLGVIERLDPTEHQLTLVPGDLIIGLTDGLSEALNSRAEILGLSALIHAAAPVQSAPLESILDALMSCYQTHTDSPAIHDDLSLLLARFAPVPEP